MKRHNFAGLPASHGVKKHHRSPGSIGSHASNRGSGRPKLGHRPNEINVVQPLERPHVPLPQRALAADQLVVVDDRLVPLLRHRQPAEDVVEERPDLVHRLGRAVGQQKDAIVGRDQAPTRPGPRGGDRPRRALYADGGRLATAPTGSGAGGPPASAPEALVAGERVGPAQPLISSSCSAWRPGREASRPSGRARARPRGRRPRWP